MIVSKHEVHSIYDLSLHPAGLMHCFEAKCVMSVNLRELHRYLLSILVDLSEPTTFHGVDHGVIHELYQ